ncbi:MAG TPA: preprotein translocase subunit SecG [Caulobacteraceae bacterium]
MLLGLLLTLNIMICLALIAVVLLQRSEGGALGSGSPTGLITTRGAGDLLTRTTWILFSLFLTISLALTLLGGRERSSQAILNRLKLQSVNPDALAATTPARPSSPGEATPPELLAPAPSAPTPAAKPTTVTAPELSAPVPKVRVAPSPRQSPSQSGGSLATPPPAAATATASSAAAIPAPSVPKLLAPAPAPLQIPSPAAKSGDGGAPVKNGPPS